MAPYFAFLKLAFSRGRRRANPTIRDLFKRCPRRDFTIGVADSRVVDIAANRTFVFIHSGFLLLLNIDKTGSGLWRGAAFDFMVISIGHRFAFFDDFSTHHLTDENSMGNCIRLADYFRFDISHRIIGYNRRSGCSGGVINALKFIGFPTRFKPEITDKRKRRILGKNGNSKNLAFINVIVVRFFLLIATAIMAGSEATWITVLAICPFTFFAVLAADHEHAVTHFEKCFGVHFIPPRIFYMKSFSSVLQRAVILH